MRGGGGMKPIWPVQLLMAAHIQSFKIEFPDRKALSHMTALFNRRVHPHQVRVYFPSGCCLWDVYYLIGVEIDRQ